MAGSPKARQAITSLCPILAGDCTGTFSRARSQCLPAYSRSACPPSSRTSCALLNGLAGRDSHFTWKVRACPRQTSSPQLSALSEVLQEAKAILKHRGQDTPANLDTVAQHILLFASEAWLHHSSSRSSGYCLGNQRATSDRKAMAGVSQLFSRITL